MLGTGASIAVEMASKLWARLRWCVTGTPVAKSVVDLNSILNVLSVGRGFAPTRWRQRLVAPAMDGFDNDRDNLKFALRQVMWRTDKEGLTEDELVLPSQKVEFVRVALNPVEKYHYTRLHARMRELTLARLERSGDINLAKKNDPLPSASLLSSSSRCIWAATHPSHSGFMAGRWGRVQWYWAPAKATSFGPGRGSEKAV